jgi:membrane-bound lytic murein transglycosylase A
MIGCGPKPSGTLHDLSSAPDYSSPLPEGKLALVKITDPAQIPDFTAACGNRAGLREAVGYSLNYLSKPSSAKAFPYGEITHDHAVASLKAFAALLDSPMSSAEMNQALRRQFDVYISVGCDNRGTVLFTGYYTPIFDASPVKTARFKYPLYKAPANLVRGADGATVGWRSADGQVTKMPPRKVLEQSNLLAGNELVYLSDPFQAYVIQVQGSARLRMPDGKFMTVGYTANNGYEYRSVREELVRDGKIPAEKISLQAMIDYFEAHPDEVNTYVWRNPRFIFFAESGNGPMGSLNEPVTAMRTIATDKAIFPRACLAFLNTSLPRRLSSGIEVMPYSGFACDQDTGGAIRAAGRCDIYMGVGDEQGILAGRTYQEGKLYYLFLKPTLMTPPGVKSVPAKEAAAVGESVPTPPPAQAPKTEK